MSRSARLPDEFGSLTTGVLLHDATTGRILDVNERLERLFGYDAPTLRTMQVEDFTAPTTKFTQETAVGRIQAAADGDPQSFEWQIERGDGEICWVSVDLTGIAIGGGDCVLAEVRDITEYKARERRLRLLNRVVRHNLRNDITVLMGYAEQLKDAVEQERLEEEIETILDIAVDIGSLSDSIEEFEEIADPNARGRSRTSVNELVREQVVTAQQQYPEAAVRLDEQAAVWVLADEGLNHAISHAIENAIVHNDREQPSVEVSVTKDPESGRGEIRVVDDGPPIPEVEIEVLDASETKTDTYHGSGLGLWVMQWCIDSLGGELVFETNEPRGNVVRILLPLDGNGW
ncbi:ATP-binding protein [Haloarchaeobius litoreus]|uniref:histidine kinase n=1 Tax=Haloarchaeobius litoreus TaxID=755306 RepID=A0ABD6DDX9_9EURY|nr:PAS domain-containing sensor histidine kinase [Haloarchaeobius litoreus]